MPDNRPRTSGDDDIVTNAGVALALRIRSGYSPVGFGCTSVGEREPRRAYRKQGECPRASLVSPGCDTLSTPSHETVAARRFDLWWVAERFAI